MPKSNNRIQVYYIYEITNNLNGKTYIGQRQCPLRKTPWTDIRYMGKGKIIVAAEKKYGIENFSKRILATCHSVKILDILEIEYIHLNKEIGKAEYNIAGGGQTRCREFMTEEQKKQYNKHISEGIRNSEKWHEAMKSEERSRKLSESLKGKPSPIKGMKMSQEFCDNVSKAITEMYNSPKGEIVRQKIKLVRANQIITDKTKLKMSLAKKGKLKSEKTKRKMSDTQKGHTVSEETRQKIREARAKQTPMSEESRQKRKKSIAEYWNSPKGQEQKRINSEKNKGRTMTKGFHWYNNGTECIRTKECPPGFVKGRLGNFTCSEEAKKKKSDWWKNLSEEEKVEYKKHLSESHKGKSFSEERKRHIS